MIIFKLKPYLKEKHITMTQMAKDIGISRQSLSAIANNSVTMVQLETLNKISSYLNVPINEIIIENKNAMEVKIELHDCFFNENNHDNVTFLSTLKINYEKESEYNLPIRFIHLKNLKTVIIKFEMTYQIYDFFQMSVLASNLSNNPIDENQSFIGKLIVELTNTLNFKGIEPTEVAVLPSQMYFWSFNYELDGNSLKPALINLDKYENNESLSNIKYSIVNNINKNNVQ